MKQVSITKIRLDNPMLATYVKTIENWDKNGEFYSKEKVDAFEDKNFTVEVAERLGVPQENGYFYGIFWDDKFLGASTMKINQQNAAKEADVIMVNGSIQHSEQIEKAAIESLTIIAQAKYNNVDRINVKKISLR